MEYLIGYGSLISPKSRGKTFDFNSLVEAEVLPVIVKSYRRTFSVECVHNGSDPDRAICYRAVGVHRDHDSSITAVLIPLGRSKKEDPSCKVKLALEAFDERESGYQRHLVNLDSIRIWAGHERSEQSIENLIGHDAKVWIYAFENPPSNDVLLIEKDKYPLAQTYIDVCLSGCLDSFGEHFARDFLKHTSFFDHIGSSSKDYFHWINDRNPEHRNKRLYKRAHSPNDLPIEEIDQLLHEFGYLSHRSD